MKLVLLKDAGLVSLHTDRWSLHLGVYPGHWVWGRDVEEYDCCLDYVGAGPAFLFVQPP